MSVCHKRNCRVSKERACSLLVSNDKFTPPCYCQEGTAGYERCISYDSKSTAHHNLFKASYEPRTPLRNESDFTCMRRAKGDRVYYHVATYR